MTYNKLSDFTMTDINKTVLGVTKYYFDICEQCKISNIVKRMEYIQNVLYNIYELVKLNLSHKADTN